MLVVTKQKSLQAFLVVLLSCSRNLLLPTVAEDNSLDDCPPGSFNVTLSRVPSFCMLCPPNSYQDQFGKNYCLGCNSSMYNGTGSNSYVMSNGSYPKMCVLKETTLAPTTTPTTSNPSRIPTSRPSHTSSSSPTPWPSLGPSGLPSLRPSFHPSSTASSSPWPSLGPSSSPPLRSSSHPSSNGSSPPSPWPSLGPSSLPSLHPSITPSLSPTSPRVTRSPSSLPRTTGREQPPPLNSNTATTEGNTESNSNTNTTNNVIIREYSPSSRAFIIFLVFLTIVIISVVVIVVFCRSNKHIAVHPGGDDATIAVHPNDDKVATVTANAVLVDDKDLVNDKDAKAKADAVVVDLESPPSGKPIATVVAVPMII